MAQKLLIVEDNTAPDITLTLQRDGTAINLSTASGVDLYITLNGTVTNTGHTTCSINTPLEGIVAYSPDAVDFSTPGTYQAEVKITYGDGTVETVYEKFKIVARTKLGT